MLLLDAWNHIGQLCSKLYFVVHCAVKPAENQEVNPNHRSLVRQNVGETERMQNELEVQALRAEMTALYEQHNEAERQFRDDHLEVVRQLQEKATGDRLDHEKVVRQQQEEIRRQRLEMINVKVSHLTS